MSYEKIDGIPVRENEASVILDSGDIIAVSIDRSVSGSRIVFAGTARCINEDGTSRIGVSGSPITSELRHTDPRASIADQILRDCFLALIGEPVSIMEWSPQWLLDVSIRQAISVSTISNTDPSTFI